MAEQATIAEWPNAASCKSSAAPCGNASPASGAMKIQAVSGCSSRSCRRPRCAGAKFSRRTCRAPSARASHRPRHLQAPQPARLRCRRPHGRAQAPWSCSAGDRHHQRPAPRPHARRGLRRSERLVGVRAGGGPLVGHAVLLVLKSTKSAATFYDAFGPALCRLACGATSSGTSGCRQGARRQHPC